MAETGNIDLKEYIEKLIAAHLREHEKESDARRRELELADAKFLKANEVREQIDRERGNFITREMHDALIAETNARIIAMADDFARRIEAIRGEDQRRFSALERWQSTTDGKILGAGAVLTLIFTAISVLFHFVK